ncbi:hypothetical protein SCB49_02514 [unidentified eubacterium SCB49]|nr:hypothetical protein SCB49_02514 [unidentified eubacterium SCB49]
MANYNRKQIDIAYRKLKSYVYYDNFSLLLRQQLAHFESGDDFDGRLDALSKALSNPAKNKKYFKNLLSSIDYYTAPKKFSPIRSEKQLVISNNFTASNYKLSKVNYFIQASVEIHLISILWILYEGYSLHKMYSKNNYAYNLELESGNGEVVDGLRLFKPYFEQYQKWRDNGIEMAKNILDEDIDVVILSIDIKEYYYNINIDKVFQDKLSKDIKGSLNKRKLFFTDLLFDIMRAYQKICPHDSNNILPIGLLSSGILANYYLKDFDEEIKSELAPAYYGRYVDDIQIVLSNTKLDFDSSSNDSNVIDKYLNKFLVKQNLFSQNETDKSFCYNKLPKIKIQQDKILLYAFESKESKAVLEMFKRRIEQNSSAFWFLPAESDITNDFDDSVYELSYSDTVNKLRSVQGINQSKYGAAVFLAKKIKVSLLSDKNDDDETKKQILTFFKGIVSLEFAASWEKVLTYFVIIDDRESFWEFFKEISMNINKVTSGDIAVDKRDIVDVKEYLIIYLENCCALATALNPSFVDDDWWSSKKQSIKSRKLKNSFEYHGEINAIKRAYIASNLLRNNFIISPLLNYLKLTALNSDKLNFTKQEGLRKIKFSLEDLEFDDFKIKYAPRFIYFFEFNLCFLLKEILKYYKKDIRFEKMDLFFEKNEQVIYDKIFDVFFKTNYQHRLSITPRNLNFQKEKLKKNYFKITEGSNLNDNIGYNNFNVPFSGSNVDRFKVAIANTTVNLQDIKDSIFEKPNTAIKRRKKFIGLLNAAEKEKTDALILPEVSVPYSWLPILSDESRRKQRLIVAGLEHLSIGRKTFNLLVTCLPLEHNGIKDAIINLRLKYHYSPGESKIIKEQRRIIPKTNFVLYNLFKWRGVHFSNYNCYELADIYHRSLFKGKVDILIASEYNQDVNYFSNIAESVSRDIHCVFIQVNTSDYGDSRITLPKKTALKDILRLKGGENDVILTSSLNIRELRNFQKISVQYQDTRKYKNTPPDFDHDSVEER